MQLQELLLSQEIGVTRQHGGGQSVPVSADDVIINSGTTVTIDIADAQCASLTFASITTSSGLIISGSNSLTIAGELYMPRPGYGDLCTVNVGAGNLTCGSLTMLASTGGRTNKISISSGTMSVTGNISTGAAACIINLTSTGTFNAAGVLTGSPTVTTATGSTFNYTGNVEQAVYPISYLGNLGLSGTGAKTFSGATTVYQTLFLTNGMAENENSLTMADGSTISRSSGYLTTAPTFAGTINLVYTGSLAITTGYEMPVAAGVLNNLTTNSGGIIQDGTPGTPINILTESFANLDSWTGDGDIGKSYNQFRSVNSSKSGGTKKECRYVYGNSSSVVFTSSIYRMVNTTGYSVLNIKWKQFIDNYDALNYSYTLKVQCANSLSGTWHDLYTYTPVTNTDIGPDNKTYDNWTTDVGGDFYIRFYITGYTWGINYWFFDDLVIEGLTPETASITTVNGTLDLTAGSYSIASNTLNIKGDLTGSSAIIGNSFSNLIVEGTGSNLTIPLITGELKNFTINRATGVSLNSDVSVNGELSMVANPSATQGSLHIVADTITMGPSAATIGAGDVTGFVKRTSFLPNVSYSFGNQYTNVTFTGSGTFPSQLNLKINIGSAPTWKSTAVKRLYDFVQTGGNGCLASISTHYLDSELNGNSESQLSQWTNGTPGPPLGLYDWGRSNLNLTNNWVSVDNIDIGQFPTTFGSLENTLAKYEPVAITWDGSEDSDWTNMLNWEEEIVPTNSSNVIIPDATSTANDPNLPSSTEIVSLTLQTGSILNSPASAVLTINGANGAWFNTGGVFNPNSSNIIFSNAEASISGITNFYDLTVADGAILTPSEDNIIRIADSLIRVGTGELNLALLPNTVEYNGNNQTIIIPSVVHKSYYHLILSSSGTKTLPNEPLSISGNLTMSGTSSFTALDVLTIGGNFTFESGNTVDLGSFSHTLGGNFTNNGGTLTSALSSISFNGNAQQIISSSPGISFNNVTITNTNAPIVLGTSTDCSIDGNLAVNTGSILDLGANSLTAITGSLANSGTVKTQSTSLTPVPSGRTWGGNFEFTGNVAQTLVAGTYNNLAITGTGGVTATADITVNGILNLASSNVSAVKGILETNGFSVYMGSSSTTVGQGDLTGIVRRIHTILPNTVYTFGHQNTSMFFPNVGTLPTSLGLKISLGTEPSWKTGSIKRIYNIVQIGGSGTQALFHANYLDSELNGNIEDSIVSFMYIYPSTTLIEYGRSDLDIENNIFTISNVDMSYFYSTFGNNEITFDESGLTALTWNGSLTSSWVTAGNWTPNGAPSYNTAVTIPDAETTPNDPEIPIIASCKSIKLESGSILNSITDAELTLEGGINVWVNAGGTFNCGNSTLVFSNSAATMTDSTDFYNLTIEAGAVLTLDTDAYMGIYGTLSDYGAISTFAVGSNTIEYKGGDQTAIVPNRETNRYDNLILSGTGTKTMPITPLEIVGDLIISGSASVLAGNSVNTKENFTIGEGTTFITGAFNHTLSGNFINNGTLSAAGSTITCNDTLAQSLSGTSATTYNNLIIDNPIGVTLESDALTTVSGTLTINADRRFEVASGKELTVSGVISNNAGASGLILKSDVSGTASLIHSSANVPATVERFVTGSQWHYMFAPLSTIPTSVYTTEGSDINYNLYSYNETNEDYWDAIYTYGTTGWTPEYSNTNLPTSKGYIFNRYNMPDKTFTQTGGNLFSGQKDFTVSYNEHNGEIGNDVTQDWPNFDGWNLVGNPFASAIDWDIITKPNIEAGVYLFDGTNYKYYLNGVDTSEWNVGITLNGGTNFIPSGQAFFVKVKNTGGTHSETFSIPENARVHNNVAYWKKSSKTTPNILKLNISNGDFTDETVIRTIPDATLDHDADYDANKLFSWNNLLPQLYSESGSSNYFAINTLPEFKENTVIPLGVYTGVSGEYSINVVDDSFFGYHIYLKDELLNISQNISIHKTYNFNQAAENNTDRFKLNVIPNHAPTTEGIKDQTVFVTENYDFVIPENTFRDMDLDDVLILSVSLSDGNLLPEWLYFNSSEKRFSGVSDDVQSLNIKVTATDFFGQSVYSVFNLNVIEKSLGVENQTKFSINVYPNPNKGIFNIRTEGLSNSKLIITDITGRIIFKKAIISENETINLSASSKGIYLIKIQSKKGTFTKKLQIR